PAVADQHSGPFIDVVLLPFPFELWAREHRDLAGHDRSRRAHLRDVDVGAAPLFRRAAALGPHEVALALVLEGGAVERKAVPARVDAAEFLPFTFERIWRIVRQHVRPNLPDRVLAARSEIDVP